MRTIDADALIDTFEKIKSNPNNRLQDVVFLNGAMSVIDNAPTIDVVPVVHAKWVWDGFDEIGWRCSACKHEKSRFGSKPWDRFCPSCGAKMDA